MAGKRLTPLPLRQILNNCGLAKILDLNRKVVVPGRDLIEAIDDYVEKLTGDRRTLHAQHHWIRRHRKMPNSAMRYPCGESLDSHQLARKR
jgi:hypothetical protein